MSAIDLAVREDIDRIVAVEHHDPHRVLGHHRLREGGPGSVIRAWRPDALFSHVTASIGILRGSGAQGKNGRRCRPGDRRQ